MPNQAQIVHWPNYKVNTLTISNRDTGTVDSLVIKDAWCVSWQESLTLKDSDVILQET